jgi:D-alanyl-lipoteichoic acid acyltransferase DltB (MBOAT superfamily)
VQLLRWTRGYYLRVLPLMFVIVAMLLVWEWRTWLFVLLALSVVIWLQSVTSLSLRIRREERRERD